MLVQMNKMNETVVPDTLILHEGKHGVLDGVEDMDDIFGVPDEERHHRHRHEESGENKGKKKDSIFRRHRRGES
ncbi:hypothetical protein MCG44_00110 [Lawsonibacter sp. OA9]|uniref:hypothetical protein n=1 Tax=Oscillospiraceae TaxID=216572 RepID=UPI001F06B3A4|nr:MULTISPECIES: hypothetical protein [Oscillospiraceae]MCH1978160.1 hypothetical protein [Lawsonibacter sp. OA9]MCH1981662.1 hypothetical protein [Ruminococcus sp. OA3]